MNLNSDITPVIFRVTRAAETEGMTARLHAVFPTIPWDRAGRQASCYTMLDGHGGCDRGWLRRTRPALPEEYGALKRRLELLGYRLKVYQRITPRHLRAFREEIGFRPASWGSTT